MIEQHGYHLRHLNNEDNGYDAWLRWVNETDAKRIEPDGKERDGPTCNALAMTSPSGTEEKGA